ncbi:hypothetical protein [Escherichia coli]|uniref:hypothetical protein n=1 Tax=Escherichia coli TaxID=562 RepID=UPI0022371CA0|nr:hypothetical protein [Escherichia coli]MCW7209401.1 hypothetical protein [Escherichia coli]
MRENLAYGDLSGRAASIAPWPALQASAKRRRDERNSVSQAALHVVAAGPETQRVMGLKTPTEGGTSWQFVELTRLYSLVVWVKTRKSVTSPTGAQ